MRTIRFNWDTQIDQSKHWIGYTDGTFWNGWPNVWVENQTFLEMMDFLDSEADASNTDDADSRKQMRELPRDVEGLVCIGYGYTPTILGEPE